MNLQDILFPIRDVAEWTFGLLELGGNNVNWLLILTITGLLVYWTAQLVKFQKDEIPNR